MTLVLGIDPGARALGFARLTQRDRRWLILSAGTHHCHEPCIENMVRNQAKRFGESTLAYEVEIAVVESHVYQGPDRTTGEQAIWIPWLVGWIERDLGSQVARLVTLTRSEVLSHVGIRGKANQTRIKAACKAIFGDSAKLLKNEHERSAAFVAVAGAARVRGGLAA